MSVAEAIEETGLYGVHPEEIPEVWLEVLPLIQEAIAHSNGEYAYQDVLAELLRGSWQLWRHPLGIVVTKISQFPQMKTCHVILCAGERIRSWLDQLDVIEEWARLHGCEALTLQGRKGWKAVLGSGWRTEIAMTKRIIHEHD